MELGDRHFTLSRALLDFAFEVGRELIEFFESCASVILPPPGSESRAGQTDEGSRMEGPFEKGDVAEDFEMSCSSGITFQPSAALC